MSQISQIRRCYNCGAVLQSKSAKEKGYIDGDILSQYNGGNQVLYCQKCYDILKGVNAGALEQNIDKATSSGLMHKNKANRQKSRLMKMNNKLEETK